MTLVHHTPSLNREFNDLSISFSLFPSISFPISFHFFLALTISPFLFLSLGRDELHQPRQRSRRPLHATASRPSRHTAVTNRSTFGIHATETARGAVGAEEARRRRRRSPVDLDWRLRIILLCPSTHTCM